MQFAINDYQDRLIETINNVPDQAIQRFADELYECYLRQGIVFIVGNGGSAATASHFACDLMKGTRTGELPTFKVICPTDSIPGLTAWSNDVDYSRALAEHVAAFATEGDLLIAISTSGNSRNILETVQVAKHAGVKTLAMTGRTGGALAELADFVLYTPADLIEHIEDLHLIVSHCLCVALREEIHTRSEVEERLIGMALPARARAPLPQEIANSDAG